MKEKDPGAWLTLNSSYYTAATGNPFALLEDATLLLEQAQGIVHVMRQVLQLSPYVNREAMVLAMQAVTVLMDMSAGSTEAAHVRLDGTVDALASRH